MTPTVIADVKRRLAAMLPAAIERVEVLRSDIPVTEAMLVPKVDEYWWRIVAREGRMMVVKELVRETEWLHICWLIEEQLTPTERKVFTLTLMGDHFGCLPEHYWQHSHAAWLVRGCAIIIATNVDKRTESGNVKAQNEINQTTS